MSLRVRPHTAGDGGASAATSVGGRYVWSHNRTFTTRNNNSNARTVLSIEWIVTKVPITDKIDLDLVPGPDASDSDLDVLRYIRLQPEPFATARDIEPQMNVGYKQTRNRLDRLAQEELLNRKKVGTTNVYWLSEKGKNRLADDID